jgi:hypothetical protein
MKTILTIAILASGLALFSQTNVKKSKTPAPEISKGYISPFASLVEVPIQNVDLTQGFWKIRFDLIKDVTIPKMFEYMHADSSSHYRNFLIYTGQMQGKWAGTYWHDGDLYKWLESVVYVYQVTKDPKLDKLMDEVIAVIGKVQQPDGYISTFIQMNNKERFQNKSYHELYNLGHLMTVAARHYEATGKTNLLDIGKKTADFLYQTFVVNRPARLNPFGFNPSNIMGAVDIYRATGDQHYLTLANEFVSMRGTSGNLKKTDYESFIKHDHAPGEDNNQDKVPFRKEKEAVGHAVTATYLYAGAADVYLETGEKALMEASNRIWNDVVKRKISIHGGVGPVPMGLSIRNDKIMEGFDRAYSLPMKESYNETCANIGNVMWDWRLYKSNPNVKYLEVMESGIYNSALSGIGLDGFSFYYRNPLRRFSKEVGLPGWNESFERTEHLDCYCCPPQLARHIAGFRHYLYAVSKDKPELWINFYASGKVNAVLNNNTNVSLTQTTNYPWEGLVNIEMALKTPAVFTLKLPIPDWANGASVKLNGIELTGIVAGQFLSIERTWNNKDLVTIDLPMRIRLMKANPLVEQAKNQLAVLRGPIAYCLESTDLPKDVDFMDIVLKKSNNFSAEFKPDLLGGVYVVKTKALAVTDSEWSAKPNNAEHLYKEMGNEKVKEIDIQLIPYFSWSNRGASEMTIWIPYTN